MENKNPIRTLRDYSRPSPEGYRNTIELPDGNNVVPLQSDTIQLVQNGCSLHGLWFEDPNQHLKDFLKLVDSLDLDVANRERIWNDPRDVAKLVKEISLPQNVPSTSDRCLIELENQVQRLMEAHLAPNPPVQVNKIASSCKICNGPHDTQYCMENLEQAFFEYASSRSNEPWDLTQAQQDEVINKFNTLWKVVSEKFDNPPARDIAKDPTPRINAVYHAHHENGPPPNKGIKILSKLLSPKYQSQSSLGKQCRSSSSPKRVYFVNTITVIRKEDESREAGTNESDVAEDESRDIKRNDRDDRMYGETKEEEEGVEEESEESEEETEEEEEDDLEYFDTFHTIEELGYHEWLLKNPRPPWVSAKVIFDEKKL
ncbi:hypothetical protein Tco_0910418 [Tanacetum coccineum]|uniref:MAK10-like protein n=1 Tax=Tanacetum coccineum TaxID=301880 RepID=A0ABQ5CT61_9ASTR